MNLKESERLAIKIIKDWSFVDTNSEETKLAKAHLKAVELLRWVSRDLTDIVDYYCDRNGHVDLSKPRDLMTEIREALDEPES